MCVPPEQNVWGKYVVPMSLLYFLIMGLSASVNADVFWSTLTKNRGVLVGLACQFFLMPFLGFVAVLTFIGKQNHPVGMTLLVVTSSPGGGFSKCVSVCLSFCPSVRLLKYRRSLVDLLIACFSWLLLCSAH
jgi:predicted Na+-dependent transporter